MSTENLNLEVLEKSRKKTKPGDIFVIKPKGHDYYFGRTIITDANCGFGQGAVLIYIYNATSKTKKDIPKLEKNKLLLPPIMLNYLPWSKGYFENVVFQELDQDDILEVNCFWDPMTKKYFDDKGNELKNKYEPVGEYGLASYRVVDDKISEALGIPLSPD